MKKKIVVLQGDGIGPEIVAQAVKALKAVEKKFGHTFELEYQPFGGCAIDWCRHSTSGGDASCRAGGGRGAARRGRRP